MISIDRVLKTVLTIANTDVRGNAKSDESRLLINNSVDEIIEEYFFILNQMVSRENTGRIGSGLENISDRYREKILYFLRDREVSKQGGYFSMPEDLRYIDSVYVVPKSPTPGMIIDESRLFEGALIEECKSMKEFRITSQVNASSEYPIYIQTTNGIVVAPSTIDKIRISYLRKHKIAKWSFIVMQGNEVVNPSAPDFQDIDLHPSEESNVVLRTLNKLGINLKEQDLQAITFNKENQEYTKKIAN